ncbi:hypothetical protein HI914_02810, partial [Erysiphe necator]
MKHRHTFGYLKKASPHAHILLFLHLDDLPRYLETVEELVSARIPIGDPVLILRSELAPGPSGLNHISSLTQLASKMENATIIFHRLV